MLEGFPSPTHQHLSPDVGSGPAGRDTERSHPARGGGGPLPGSWHLHLSVAFYNTSTPTGHEESTLSTVGCPLAHSGQRSYLFLSALTPNTTGGGGRGLLSSLCGRRLVQGWASASLELKVCSGSLLSAVWGSERGAESTVLSSRRALERRPRCIHPHCQLTAGGGRDLWLRDLGQAGSISAPGQTVALDFPTDQETEVHIHTRHPFTVTHSTKLSIILHTHAPVLPYIHTGPQSDPHQFTPAQCHRHFQPQP